MHGTAIDKQSFIDQDFQTFLLDSVGLIPRQINLLNYLKLCKKKIQLSGTETQYIFIKKLQRKIYAWSYYHRFFSHKSVFRYCDLKIFEFLWHWACRRHPNKSKKWIQKKYFYNFQNKSWFFAIDCSTVFGAWPGPRNFTQELRFYASASPKAKLRSSWSEKQTNCLKYHTLIYLPFHAQALENLKQCGNRFPI